MSHVSVMSDELIADEWWAVGVGVGVGGGGGGGGGGVAVWVWRRDESLAKHALPGPRPRWKLLQDVQDV